MLHIKKAERYIYHIKEKSIPPPQKKRGIAAIYIKLPQNFFSSSLKKQIWLRVGPAWRRGRIGGWTDETVRFAVLPGRRHDPDYWCGVREQSETRIVQYEPSPGSGSLATSEITQRYTIVHIFLFSLNLWIMQTLISTCVAWRRH